MARFVVVTLLLFLLAVPAFGKGHNDIYPVSCADLWNAVKDTLGNARNYTIMVMDDDQMTASYFITGALQQRVNSVALNQQDAGCELQVQANSGYGNDDARQFKNRVGHSLAKLQAGKPDEPSKPNQKK